MSSGLETESNALKYIKQVFNTLYVTKDNESLFDLDQLRQLSKDIDDYLTEESVTANGVEDFANRFANNRHRWLSPTFGDMDIPTTVAYCLLFLSCNTSNSNENTCKNLLDEETSPLPGYLITALKSSLSAEGGTGLLNGSFERDCSYNVISNNENRNLVFYFLTLLAANMNCPLKNVLNVLYGDPTRNASIMFNELVTDEILTKVSKEIKQDDKDVALNRDMVSSCFGQLCADFEKFDVSKNDNFDEEIVKYVLASSIQPADSNPMVDSLSFMKGKSADVMLLENLTFPLDERGINVVVDGGNKCAKVTDDSLFKDIDFNQGTPQENDFYKNHFATCMTLPLSNDSDTAVSFDTQPLYLLQQLRNKMISIQSSPNVSPEMVEQITKAINELNSMQQRFLLGKILPELLCNYFLNVFNLFLSVVSKQQKNMKANIEMVNSDLAPAEFEALQENPEITSLSAETRKKLGISRRLMYDIVTSVDEVGNDGATIPEGPGQVATAIKLATELMKGAELKLGDILPVGDEKVQKNTMISNIKSLAASSSDEQFNTILASINEKIEASDQMQPQEILKTLCSGLPDYLKKINSSFSSDIEELCNVSTTITTPIPESETFDVVGSPDIEGMQSNITYQEISAKIGKIDELISKVREFVVELKNLAEKDDISEDDATRFVASEVSKLPKGDAIIDLQFFSDLTKLEPGIMNYTDEPEGFKLFDGILEELLPVIKQKLTKLAVIVRPGTTYESVETDLHEICASVASIVRDIYTLYSYMIGISDEDAFTEMISLIQASLPQNGGAPKASASDIQHVLVGKPITKKKSAAEQMQPPMTPIKQPEPTAEQAQPVERPEGSLAKSEPRSTPVEDGVEMTDVSAAPPVQEQPESAAPAAQEQPESAPPVPEEQSDSTPSAAQEQPESAPPAAQKQPESGPPTPPATPVATPVEPPEADPVPVATPVATPVTTPELESTPLSTLQFINQVMGPLMKQLAVSLYEVTIPIRGLCMKAKGEYLKYRLDLLDLDTNLTLALLSNSTPELEALQGVFKGIMEYSAEREVSDNFYIKQMAMLREERNKLQSVISMQVKVAGQEVPPVMKLGEQAANTISGLGDGSMLASIKLDQIIANSKVGTVLSTNKGKAQMSDIIGDVRASLPSQFQDFAANPTVEDFLRNTNRFRQVFMSMKDSANIASKVFKEYLNACLKNLEDILLENYTNFELETGVADKVVLSDENMWNAFKGPGGAENENFFINQRDMAILGYMSNIISQTANANLDDNVKRMQGKSGKDEQSELFLYQDRKLLLDVKLLNDAGNIDYMGGLFMSLLQLSDAHTKSSGEISNISFNSFYEGIANAIRASCYLTNGPTKLSFEQDDSTKSAFMKTLKTEIPSDKILQTLTEKLMLDPAPQLGGAGDETKEDPPAMKQLKKVQAMLKASREKAGRMRKIDEQEKQDKTEEVKPDEQPKEGQQIFSLTEVPGTTEEEKKEEEKPGEQGKKEEKPDKQDKTEEVKLDKQPKEGQQIFSLTEVPGATEEEKKEEEVKPGEPEKKEEEVKPGEPEKKEEEVKPGEPLDLKQMLNKYANDIVTEEADKKHIGKVFARLPSLNNDGKMVDFLMGYDENGVFILPTKELTSEAADIASRKRITESAADVAAPKKSSMVMFGQRKATYHQESQPPSEPK